MHESKIPYKNLKIILDEENSILEFGIHHFDTEKIKFIKTVPNIDKWGIKLRKLSYGENDIGLSLIGTILLNYPYIIINKGISYISS